MKIGKDAIRGRRRFHRVDDKGLWLPVTPWRHNLVVYEWGAIVANLLASGDSNYHINGMYLHFGNVAHSGDKVTIPDVTREWNADYYHDLSALSTVPVDYLWAPMAAANVTSSNVLTYPKGNRVNFFACSQGVAGLNGLGFRDDLYSTVFGVALVAMRDSTDRSQDLVLSAAYYEADDQQAKLPSSQIGVQWQLELQ